MLVMIIIVGPEGIGWIGCDDVVMVVISGGRMVPLSLGCIATLVYTNWIVFVLQVNGGTHANHGRACKCFVHPLSLLPD